ncbi:MAG: twin-arginine translocase TatA/TatE family subunit [Candidatus Omnitrophica bacterium]|nr:twin-arginine translocase TatA/TatE family subunit [Candidatus Omnitrophota bacterium]MBU4479110.1 twin-arginine translocase TatA/TatE family subunit [Candidatus Omnitrophota bacterium]MCG2703413.1 twin-arginine translocase TatA/TatE family subunit [Candidatus Omnitrophota bacterium]
MGRFGISELVLIFFILLLLFGARKLPEIARSLGESIKEFKKSISKGESNQDEQKKDV